MVSKLYLEKLKEELVSKLKLSSKKIVVSSSSSKKVIAYYSKLNSTLGKAKYKELEVKLTKEELEELEEYFDEYLEGCTDFCNSKFYYLNSLLGILETLLDTSFNIEFTN